MHGARLSQPFCPVDSSSASISRLHPYGPPLASPSICMLGSGRQRRKDDCPISSMIVLSYTIVQPTAMAMRYSMTARRGPNWLRPRLLATAESCTRLSSIHWATIIKRPTRACAVPACAAPVDRSQHASSIPPMAMASPVSELIHNVALPAILALPTVPTQDCLSSLPLLRTSSVYLPCSSTIIPSPSRSPWYRSLFASSIPLTQTCPLLPPMWP